MLGSVWEKIYIKYVFNFLKNFFKAEKIASSKAKIFCHLEIYWFFLGKSFFTGNQVGYNFLFNSS